MHAAKRLAMPSRCSTARNPSNPPSEESRSPSNRASIDLPETGDRPGRIGVFATEASMAFRDGVGWIRPPISTSYQGFILCSPVFVHNTG